MKLLVFGSGFISEKFIEYWQNKYTDSEIIIFYNKHKTKFNNLPHYNMNEIDTGKILNEFLPEFIICFQGNSFVSDNKQIKQAINNNVIKTSELLETININKLQNKIKKILIIGSAGEYGKLYDTAIKEDIELSPNSLYGLSKTILYEVYKYYCKLNLPITYVRQFNTTGTSQQDKFVLPAFVKQIVQIEKKMQSNTINVGDLTQERDFIDIKDTCSAYDIILNKGKTSEVYNVASGSYISIGHLLNKIIDISILDKDEIVINSDPNMFSSNSLSKRLYADISKLKKLGFKCEYKIEDTIKEMIEFWRKNV